MRRALLIPFPTKRSHGIQICYQERSRLTSAAPPTWQHVFFKKSVAEWLSRSWWKEIDVIKNAFLWDLQGRSSRDNAAEPKLWICAHPFANHALLPCIAGAWTSNHTAVLWQNWFLARKIEPFVFRFVYCQLLFQIDLVCFDFATSSFSSNLFRRANSLARQLGLTGHDKTMGSVWNSSTSLKGPKKCIWLWSAEYQKHLEGWWPPCCRLGGGVAASIRKRDERGRKREREREREQKPGKALL